MPAEAAKEGFRLVGAWVGHDEGLAAAEVEAGEGRLVGHCLGETENVFNGVLFCGVGPDAAAAAGGAEGGVVDGDEGFEADDGVGADKKLLVAFGCHEIQDFHGVAPISILPEFSGLAEGGNESKCGYNHNMVRFLHTADWQLGMTRHFLKGEAQARFSAARLDAIEQMGNIAVNEGCEFVVVCGDVFESNQVERRVITRAFEKMAAFPSVTFYLLPGNHDTLDASSVYRSETFVKHRPENVKVLDGSEAVKDIPGVELIAAPWRNKHPTTDLVGDACQELEPTHAVRIVVGHGAVRLRSRRTGTILG